MDYKISIWNILTGLCEITLEPTCHQIKEIECKNNILVTGCEKGDIQFWDIGKGGVTEAFANVKCPYQSTMCNGKVTCYKMMFVDDDTVLCSVGNTVYVFDSRTGRSKLQSLRCDSPVIDMLVMGKGKVVMCLEWCGNVIMWDVQENNVIEKKSIGNTWMVKLIPIEEDLVIACGSWRSLIVINKVNGSMYKTRHVMDSRTMEMLGGEVVVGGEEHRVRFWRMDVERGNC